jgi:hypothetical protein
MSDEKKKWQTPELVVLLRNKPEEAVLSSCKFYPGIPSGPSWNHDSFCKEPCPPCYEHGLS